MGGREVVAVGECMRKRERASRGGSGVRLRVREVAVEGGV